MLSAYISMMGLIAAGVVGVVVGAWSNHVLAKKLDPPPHSRCRICAIRHDDDNHEHFEGWEL